MYLVCIVLTITWLGSAVECQQTSDATVTRTLNLHGDRISDLENIVKRLLADNQGLQRNVGELKAENVALKGNLQTLENQSMNCCSKGITQTTTRQSTSDITTTTTTIATSGPTSGKPNIGMSTSTTPWISTTRTTSRAKDATNASSLPSTTTTTGRGSNHTSTGVPTNMVSTMLTYPSTPSTTRRPSSTPTTTQTTQSTTKRPSTTPTTTQTTPPSITQRMQPVTCMRCVGPQEICEQLYAPTTCPPPNNYCVNTLINNASGARDVIRSCGNEAVCRRDWWQSTSDRDVCTHFDETSFSTRSFNCTFCCTTDNCNAQLVPDWNTLYVP